MLGILLKSEIENVLMGQIYAHLGCHHNNKTYVVPISYAYDGTDIYCHSFEGMKTEMMRANPNVCLQVDDMNNMSDWKSVICWGEAREIVDEAERHKAVGILAGRKLPILSSETTHLFSDWPFGGKGESLPGALFVITISEKTGRYERTASRDKRHDRQE